MTWLQIAYLFTMIYLAVNRQKQPEAGSLRMAWIWFAFIPICHLVFALFRAGNYGSVKDMALVEIWDEGISSLLLGISMLYLTGTIARDSNSGTGSSIEG